YRPFLPPVLNRRTPAALLPYPLQCRRFLLPPDFHPLQGFPRLRLRLLSPQKQYPVLLPYSCCSYFPSFSLTPFRASGRPGHTPFYVFLYRVSSWFIRFFRIPTTLS